MNTFIVKVEHLSHKYGTQWAVRDVNFNIPQRGVCGLLGRNGAGKSTIMNILCGVLRQTEGKLKFSGLDMQEHLIEVKKMIGFLPQVPPLFGDFTVEEYLAYTARLRLLPESLVDSSVNEVLALCRIEHFRKKILKHLSGGYQQRVGIAQAIIHKPKLVVLDEPTNGLDPVQLLEVRRLIRQIAEERAVVFSTHLLSEIESTCDYILMMNEGKMIFEGTLDSFAHYLTPTTITISMGGIFDMDKLKLIEGVVQVEELGEGEYRLHFDGNGQEVIDRLLERGVLEQWDVRGICQEKCSLDKIFMELSHRRK